ncbi:hypothetical protein HDV01_006993 [Terramyces sp. JEL0728]|nr:hypothetical protein HDV01_006993 [Terramyces sp. JEL0728]
MSYRMRRLYYIIVLAQTAEGYKFWTPMLVPYSIPVFLAVLGSAVPDKFESSRPIVTSSTIDNIPGCTVQLDQLWFLYALFISVFVQLVHTWILTFLVSRVRSAFNEFKENFLINILATILIFLCFGLVFSGASFYQWGKISILMCGSLYTFVADVGPLVAPLIGFLVDKDTYEREWKRGLRDESLPQDLNYSIGDATTIYSMPSMGRLKSKLYK